MVPFCYQNGIQQFVTPAASPALRSMQRMLKVGSERWKGVVRVKRVGAMRGRLRSTVQARMPAVHNAVEDACGP